MTALDLLYLNISALENCRSWFFLKVAIPASVIAQDFRRLRPEQLPRGVPEPSQSLRWQCGSLGLERHCRIFGNPKWIGNRILEELKSDLVIFYTTLNIKDWHETSRVLRGTVWSKFYLRVNWICNFQQYHCLECNIFIKFDISAVNITARFSVQHDMVVTGAQWSEWWRNMNFPYIKGICSYLQFIIFSRSTLAIVCASIIICQGRHLSPEL